MPFGELFPFLNRSQPVAAQPPAAEPAVLTVSPEPSPAKTATELVADAMAALRQQLRAAETQAYQQHQQDIADATARIAAAKSFCERTGLGNAVAAICETVSPWHAWIQRPDATKWVPLDIPGLTAQPLEREEPGLNRRSSGYDVSWIEPASGARYTVACFRTGRWEGTDFADAVVSENGDVVLVMQLAKDLTAPDWKAVWRPREPSRLTPGPWIAAVLGFDHQLRLHKQRWRQNDEAERLKAQAAGLPPIDQLS